MNWFLSNKRWLCVLLRLHTWSKISAKASLFRSLSASPFLSLFTLSLLAFFSSLCNRSLWVGLYVCPHACLAGCHWVLNAIFRVWFWRKVHKCIFPPPHTNSANPPFLLSFRSVLRHKIKKPAKHTDTHSLVSELYGVSYEVVCLKVCASLSHVPPWRKTTGVINFRGQKSRSFDPVRSQLAFGDVMSWEVGGWCATHVSERR